MALPPNQLGDITATTGTSDFVQTGSLCIYPSSTIPAGWLLCDGSSYGQTDPRYNALYAMIGISFNKPGSAVGQFCVPDLIQRAPVRWGNTDPTIDISGSFAAYDGSGGIVIPVEALPPHSHNYQAYPYGVVQSLGIGTNSYQTTISTTTVGVTNMILDKSGIPITSQAPVNVRNPYTSLNYLIKL